MKHISLKRISLILLTALLLCSALFPLPAQAAGKPYGSVPILIGDPEADLLAEKILAGINTAGLNDKQKIQKVYDWIILNCVREDNDGSYSTPRLTVTDQEIAAYSAKAADLLARGEAVIRKELVEQYTDYTMEGHEDYMFMPSWHDNNDYIASFGAYIMMYRVGNCAHFSSMLAILLGHLGYDVRLIPGEFINRNGTRVMHKWNCVLVGDKYYWLDVRIDDNVTSGTNVTHYYFYESNTDTWAKQHDWVRGYTDQLQRNVSAIKGQYADPPAHTHEYVQLSYSSPCTEAHWKAQSCSVCGAYLLEWIPAKEHTWSMRVTWKPTCTENGWAEYDCTVCGAYKSGELAPLGHVWKVEEVLSEAEDGGHGTARYTCTRCGGEKEAALCSSEVFTDAPRKGNWAHAGVDWAFFRDITKGTTDTTFSPKQTCTRGQVVTFLWRAAGQPKAEDRNNPFTDVKQKSFYYEAVLWAVENGITNGMTETTFSPGKDCTRGQVLTFLWRAAKPAQETGKSGTEGSVPFTDVKKNAYYYKAVLWAVEHNVTTGTSATTFSPNSTCTRAQIVTFLWRYAGEPAPKTASNPFTDVKAGEYYYNAVLWAVENGITKGTSATTFHPYGTCTRAEVVTFLYRYREIA